MSALNITATRPRLAPEALRSSTRIRQQSETTGSRLANPVRWNRRGKIPAATAVTIHVQLQTIASYPHSHRRSGHEAGCERWARSRDCTLFLPVLASIYTIGSTDDGSARFLRNEAFLCHPRHPEAKLVFTLWPTVLASKCLLKPGPLLRHSLPFSSVKFRRTSALHSPPQQAVPQLRIRISYASLFACNPLRKGAKDQVASVPSTAL